VDQDFAKLVSSSVRTAQYGDAIPKMTLRPSIILPSLFPKFVVHRSMIVSDQADASSEILLPPQLRDAVSHRVAEFISGRLCARQALTILGATQFDIPMGADRCPIWPPGFVGSITHADGTVFAAVARAAQAQSLGLDAEKIMSRETALELAPILATSDEYDRLLKSPWDHQLLTTSIFSAKETIFKCLYPIIRRQFDFLDVSITSIDSNDGTFSFSISRSLSKIFQVAIHHRGRVAVVDGLVHTGLFL
jgi:enterobactin synthetase component D